MSVEYQVNVKYQSELDIGGRETCLYSDEAALHAITAPSLHLPSAQNALVRAQ